jgi:hypothetical protein
MCDILLDDIEHDIDYVKIYKGKYFNKNHSNKYQKVLVFDLDETLGSFIDLEILWRAISKYNNTIEFSNLLDLYPEFLRYGIIPILEYLNKKKKSGCCNKVYIYTNNQCPDDWTSQIANYFNKKLLSNNDIFDRVICAFKINNKQIELSRTTHDKTHNDFINCTLLPPTTEICFIDNSYFSEMRRERVYYIRPKSYYHHLNTPEIIDRFVKSELSSQITDKIIDLRQSLLMFFKNSGRYLQRNTTFKELETDLYVAQKMMYHIKEFFFLTQSRRSRTHKVKIKLGRFTRKK